MISQPRNSDVTDDADSYAAPTTHCAVRFGGRRTLEIQRVTSVWGTTTWIRVEAGSRR